MDMNKYIEVFPNKILLKKPLSQNYYESKLILTNTTEKYVVFKVYINKSSIYSANPSTSYIKPKENITIIIKRLEINVPEQEMTKDKFLILAFPVNQVISDSNEAKALIKSSNLKAETNQEIYLETEMDTDTKSPSLNRDRETEVSYTGRAGAIFESTITTIQDNKGEVEEIKKQIEEIKKDINNYETENNKLNVQQSNFCRNSLLLKSKNKALTNENTKTTSFDQIPITFVILLVTLGLTFGAYINRIF